MPQKVLPTIEKVLSDLKASSQGSQKSNIVVFEYQSKRWFSDKANSDTFVQYVYYSQNGFILDFPIEVDDSKYIERRSTLVVSLKQLLEELSFEQINYLRNEYELNEKEYGIVDEGNQTLKANCGDDVSYVTDLTDKIFCVVYGLNSDYSVTSKTFEGVPPPKNPTDSAERKRPHIPDEVKMFVWRRDEGKCVECGCRENLEFDHIIPFSKGGSSTARNLQLLCEKCNRKKSDSI